MKCDGMGCDGMEGKEIKEVEKEGKGSKKREEKSRAKDEGKDRQNVLKIAEQHSACALLCANN